MSVSTLSRARKYRPFSHQQRNGVASSTTLFTDRGEVTIPSWVTDLASFRRWARSADFPEKIRVCFLDGEVWVDMSQEQIFTHNQVKNEFSFVLTGLARSSRLGRFFPDGLLLTNEDANLSCCPDDTFVLQKTFADDRVQLVAGAKGGFVEMHGTPDIVLEIVSDSSVKKDTVTLRELYWKASIPEYWFVDVRSDKDVFEIHRHSAKGYVAARKHDGWAKSNVLGKSCRLMRGQDERGHPEFTLEVK